MPWLSGKFSGLTGKALMHGLFIGVIDIKCVIPPGGLGYDLVADGGNQEKLSG